MEKNLEKIKYCVDCGKIISFKEFCDNNQLPHDDRASALYFDPLISIYCHECFFERPEKPFKVKRRNILFYSSKFRL